MPWLAWRWTVCPAPFLPLHGWSQLDSNIARGGHHLPGTRRELGIEWTRQEMSDILYRHIYSFLVYLRFFLGLSLIYESWTQQQDYYLLFHIYTLFVFATQ